MTTPRKTTILLATTALVAPAAWAQPDPEHCEHRNTVNLSDPAGGTLEVKSGAGAVEITGEPGLSEFRVAATLCAASAELLDGLAVSLQGGRLDTTYPERRSGGWGFWRNNYASIHLAVRVSGRHRRRTGGQVRIGGDLGRGGRARGRRVGESSHQRRPG